MTITSAIIYRGPSMADGRPIMAVISQLGPKGSDNAKTGDMAQIDILLEDEHPVEARKTGHDSAICGACPLRVSVCYVNVGFGPASKYRAVKRGNVPEMTPGAVGAILRERGRAIRIGAYGDPGMVPFEIWRALLDAAGTAHTSYTHQWRESWFDPRHLSISMASVDYENTVEELRERFPDARHYRLASDYGDVDRTLEVKCPSKADDGTRRVQCVDCGLCGGTDRAAKSIVIVEND